ncbi:MAG: hypothetical protein V7750_15690 [Sneathiella sp.]
MPAMLVKGLLLLLLRKSKSGNQTPKATEDISGQVYQIQRATDEAVLTIKDVTATVDQLSSISTSLSDTINEQTGSMTVYRKLRPMLPALEQRL